jgi:hypothetical protein
MQTDPVEIPLLPLLYPTIYCSIFITNVCSAATTLCLAASSKTHQCYALIYLCFPLTNNAYQDAMHRNHIMQKPEEE